MRDGRLGRAMKKIETRGPAVGDCNICGVSSKLTEDHIPPKGIPLVGQAYLTRLVDAIGAEKPKKGKRHFQNGVKYRSICADCNNRLLGRQYDPVLVSFCREIHTALGRQIYLPVQIDAQINRLLRAFVGHLLAHGIDQYRKGELQSKLTDYFLNQSSRFPVDLRAYFWVYPYKPQIVAHGLGMIFDFRRNHPPFVASVMKFYPIAFMCATEDLPAREGFAVLRVDDLTSEEINAREIISLSPTSIPSMSWPEWPGTHGAVFHNNYGTVAVPVGT